jgi:hypothetical protein
VAQSAPSATESPLPGGPGEAAASAEETDDIVAADAISSPLPEPARADDEPLAETGAGTADADLPHSPDPAFDEAPGSFEDEDEPAPRRNRAKVLAGAAVAFAVLVAVLIGAASVWGMPDWVPIGRPTFADSPPDLKLEFPPERQERRTLPNGTEFFDASGSVTNVGQQTRRVPPILIVLRDAGNGIVYTSEVTPPKLTLAPGETVAIKEALTDVPPSARVAEVGWKPGWAPR